MRLQVADVLNTNCLTGASIHPISDCTWDEHAVTWNNQPAIDGPVLTTSGAAGRGQVVDYDVTSAVSGDGVYCFALETTSNDSVIYGSREAIGGHPEMVVGLTP